MSEVRPHFKVRRIVTALKQHEGKLFSLLVCKRADLASCYPPNVTDDISVADWKQHVRAAILETGATRVGSEPSQGRV